MKREWLTIRQPLLEFIDNEQPATHLSCDWLTDPLALGYIRFPFATYEKLRALNHGQPNS